MTEWLYRHRGWTAVPLAVTLVWAARPTAWSLGVGLLCVVAFEALRVAALRHAGAHTRGRSLRAPHLATGGPYRQMRHPLYVGNAGVCAGLLLASRAGWPWFPMLVAGAFLAQYALFIRHEERFLAAQFGVAWRDYAARVPAVGWGRGPAPGVPPVLTLREALRVEFSTLRTILILFALLGLRLGYR